MELAQLDYFRTVAYEESISRAARKLHISQPALSISIPPKTSFPFRKRALQKERTSPGA